MNRNTWLVISLIIVCLTISGCSNNKNSIIKSEDTKQDFENVPNSDASKVTFEENNSDPRNFVKLKWGDIMPYDLTCRLITKDNLPVLYEMLNDIDYAPYWHNVARVIGYISDDPNSVPILVDYFQRDDGSNISRVVGKIWSIALIGKIGGEQADTILKKAVTREGAEELSKAWVSKELWPDKHRNKESVIEYIQNAAMQGLVYTGKPENISIVEQIYKKEYDQVVSMKKYTKTFSAAIDAMAAKDFIADNDLDTFFSLNISELIGNLAPYFEKYSPMLQEN